MEGPLLKMERVIISLPQKVEITSYWKRGVKHNW